MVSKYTILSAALFMACMTHHASACGGNTVENFEKNETPKQVVHVSQVQYPVPAEEEAVPAQQPQQPQAPQQPVFYSGGCFNINH